MMVKNILIGKYFDIRYYCLWVVFFPEQAKNVF
jgi:hypothetical protein